MNFNNGINALNRGNYGVPNVLHPYNPNVSNSMSGGFLHSKYLDDLSKNVKDFTQTTSDRVGEMMTRITNKTKEDTINSMKIPAVIEQNPMTSSLTSPMISNQPLATQMLGGRKRRKTNRNRKGKNKGKHTRKTKHAKKHLRTNQK